MSRPKGSKNKRKLVMAEATVQESVTPEDQVETQESLVTEKIQEPVTSQSSGVTVAIDEEADKVDSYGGACQNCMNHGKQVELNKDGTCSDCGFDKSKLYGAF